jgi:hypothetical protein
LRTGFELDSLMMRGAACFGCVPSSREILVLSVEILASSIGASVGLILLVVSRLALTVGFPFFGLTTGKIKPTEASIEEAKTLHNITTKISTLLDVCFCTKGPGQPLPQLRA